MNGFFVTGTDTNIGKTLISAILMLVLKAYYWKPIQSGTPTDIDQVRFLTGLSDSYFLPSRYIFNAPLSPDQAAALENSTIDLASCTLPILPNTIITEGAGGVYTPLNKKYCMLDLMHQLNLPVIIVARGTLGTINHTLLTIAALRQRNINIDGVIFSGELNPASQRTIEEWGKVRTLFHVPFFENITPAILQEWVATHQTTILEALA